MQNRFWGFIFFMISAMSLAAQDTARIIDRVFTSDSRTYIGQITEDKKGDYLIIDVYQTATYTIEYSRITKIQYRVDNPNYKGKKEQDADAPRPTSIVRNDHYKLNADTDLVAFNGYRASPHVTDKLVKKRNTGIGLFIAGVSMIGVGTALLIASPSQSSTSSSGLLISTPSPGRIIGIVMLVAGVGITIPGAAIWGSYSSKLKKAERALN